MWLKGSDRYICSERVQVSRWVQTCARTLALCKAWKIAERIFIHSGFIFRQVNAFAVIRLKNLKKPGNYISGEKETAGPKRSAMRCCIGERLRRAGRRGARRGHQSNTSRTERKGWPLQERELLNCAGSVRQFSLAACLTIINWLFLCGQRTSVDDLLFCRLKK